MATVVQDGKMSTPTQDGLFQGKIFWLSLGVPMRSSIVDLIKTNGGSLVTNEKDADICIVDHMKNGAPEGMYSYEYITKSVITKKLEELERHRILPKGRPTASGPSRLRGHTFFSQKDDDILLETISEPGIKLYGNSIYKTLAEKYPHHTMHSWRGRWVDHFSKLMPNGPVSPKKQNTEQKETDQEENDARQKEKDVEQIRTKGDRGRFTRYDEDMLEKLADRLRATDKFDIYETLSELNPKHTPDQWHAHFNEVILPRINLGKVPKESAAKPNQASEESGGSNNEELAASSNRDSPSSKAKREVKIKPEPTTSSPAPEPKKGPPTPSMHSPIRMVDVRNRPNGAPPYPTREDITKPSTPRQRRKTTPSPPPHRPATPTGKVASIAPSKLSLPMTTSSRAKIQTPANHTLRWRAEIYKTPTTEDGDVGPILPKSLSHLSPTNQKRKRDSGSSPELRKKSRGVYENTPTESESPPRSRLLSPELLGSDANHQTSSPPPSTLKKKKLSYAELSTQAIYDQMDDDPSMEFPEIEIPSAPPTPVQSTPRPQAQPKLFTPTKPTSPTLGFAPKPPLSPTKNDPDGILEMNSFLAYCQKEFNASEKQVIYAIERASGIKQLVELVLQSIADDKPLPAHVPGVWSEEDDKVLMGADSREMKKLQERKGAAHMERRMEFLNLWNMA